MPLAFDRATTIRRLRERQMYTWDCARPRFRSSVSPLPSFAIRPPGSQHEAETKIDWVKRARAAIRLQAFKGQAATKKPE